MIILKPGTPPARAWWLLVRNVCDVCGTEYRLEAGDAHADVTGRAGGIVAIVSVCPGCGANVSTDRPARPPAGATPGEKGAADGSQ
jgi:rubredoxin